jgi:predicted dithiol-disulfide oxidoreductase (DUF899 family)
MGRSGHAWSCVLFKNDNDEAFPTHSICARGLGMLNGANHLTDVLPRDERAHSYSTEWLRRRGQYEG